MTPALSASLAPAPVLACGHTLESCPDECDGVRATWRPVVGQVFRGHTMDHGPGYAFKPDGQGGGTLTWRIPEIRPGFRAGRTRAITIHKAPHLAPEAQP